MKINWKQKLASRKFWAAVIGFVTAITAAFGISAISSEQITAIISAIGILAAYIIGESCVDASRSSGADEIPLGTDKKINGSEEDSEE